MLELKKISKTYVTGDIKHVALSDINLKFRENEFVSILGPSGSGKTTCLNILGGLDRYDSGDLIINGKSTKNFSNKDWDAYRNSSVGFVFQSYNLIPHLSVIDNVQMGMTLSGINKKERDKKSKEVLEKVGLKDHMDKKPNQLSGGQMQRVAIARALLNDPDIILADEPTGALDTKTSKQILDLIKEIAEEKLVIMVTHNKKLAEEYSDRVIKFLDGEIIDDSNPLIESKNKNDYKLKKTSMNFLTALKLSGKNIWAKKWRTLLISIASSIGIIGIALILSLSNGFNKQIKDFEYNTLSGFPIMINKEVENIDMDSLKEQRNNHMEKSNEKGKYPKDNFITAYDPEEDNLNHKNKINKDFLEYIDKIDKNLISGISYNRIIDFNMLIKGVEIKKIDGRKINLNPYPSHKNSNKYLKDNYDLLAGEYPKNKDELILVVDGYNKIDKKILEELSISTEDKNKIDFQDILDLKIKVIDNNDYYLKSNDMFVPPLTNEELDKAYSKGKKLRIAGILRAKEDVDLETISPGLLYHEDLARTFIQKNEKSDIVKRQNEIDYNILNMEKFQENDEKEEKKALISMLGGDQPPVLINIYTKDFESKEKVIKEIDKWNRGKDDKEAIVYTDLAKTFTDLTSEIMGGITLVLIAFASISLVVSLIMIGIITYISVLERKKEIGVLRSLGARKKDITRVFNAETFIIGSFSGVLAIGVTYLLIPYLNILLENMTNLENIAQLNPLHAIILISLSIILTLLGGFIPAKMAANQDPVKALNDE